MSVIRSLSFLHCAEKNNSVLSMKHRRKILSRFFLLITVSFLELSFALILSLFEYNIVNVPSTPEWSDFWGPLKWPHVYRI